LPVLQEWLALRELPVLQGLQEWLGWLVLRQGQPLLVRRLLQGYTPL
jgi:hypothetical protein